MTATTEPDTTEGLRKGRLGVFGIVFFVVAAAAPLVGMTGAVPVAIGLIALVIPYSWQRRAQSVPPIHDITTDLDNPPEFQAVIPLRADAPNSLERPDTLAAQQRAGYPDLAPVTLTMTPDQAFERTLAP